MWPASQEDGAGWRASSLGLGSGWSRHQVPAQSCQVGSGELVWRGPGPHCNALRQTRVVWGRHGQAGVLGE